MCRDEPLDVFLGKVYIASNSPKLVNQPITFVVFVENFWPGFQNLRVAVYTGNGDYKQLNRSNIDTELPNWTERMRPEFCSNVTMSLCTVATQYSYGSPGDYTARLQIED